MRRQVIHNPVHGRGGGRDPLLDLFQEIHPVGRTAAGIGLGQGLARGGAERAKDVAAAAPPIINLLPRPLAGHRRVGGHPDLAGAGEALGTERPHLVQADHYTIRRWDRVEGFDGPLF